MTTTATKPLTVDIRRRLADLMRDVERTTIDRGLAIAASSRAPARRLADDPAYVEARDANDQAQRDLSDYLDSLTDWRT